MPMMRGVGRYTVYITSSGLSVVCFVLMAWRANRLQVAHLICSAVCLL